MKPFVQGRVNPESGWCFFDTKNWPKRWGFNMEQEGTTRKTYLHEGAPGDCSLFMFEPLKDIGTTRMKPLMPHDFDFDFLSDRNPTKFKPRHKALYAFNRDNALATDEKWCYEHDVPTGSVWSLSIKHCAKINRTVFSFTCLRDWPYGTLQYIAADDKMCLKGDVIKETYVSPKTLELDPPLESNTRSIYWGFVRIRYFEADVQSYDKVVREDEAGPYLAHVNPSEPSHYRWVAIEDRPFDAAGECFLSRMRCYQFKKTGTYTVDEDLTVREVGEKYTHELKYTELRKTEEHESFELLINGPPNVSAWDVNVLVTRPAVRVISTNFKRQTDILYKCTNTFQDDQFSMQHSTRLGSLQHNSGNGPDWVQDPKDLNDDPRILFRRKVYVKKSFSKGYLWKKVRMCVRPMLCYLWREYCAERSVDFALQHHGPEPLDVVLSLPQS